MRTIKFRGKRIDNNKWVYGYYVYHKSFDRHDIWDGDDWQEIIPETLGQFIGLQDKNGKDIYEGATVHFRGTKSDEAIAIVEFKDGRFIFMIDAKAILYKDIMGWRDTEII